MKILIVYGHIYVVPWHSYRQCSMSTYFWKKIFCIMEWIYWVF